MATEPIVIPGVVRNGLVVPRGDTPLPEGAQVSIVVPAPPVSTSAPGEAGASERGGDEGAAPTEQWEREE